MSPFIFVRLCPNAQNVPHQNCRGGARTVAEAQGRSRRRKDGRGSARTVAQAQGRSRRHKDGRAGIRTVAQAQGRSHRHSKRGGSILDEITYPQYDAGSNKHIRLGTLLHASFRFQIVYPSATPIQTSINSTISIQKKGDSNNAVIIRKNFDGYICNNSQRVTFSEPLPYFSKDVRRVEHSLQDHSIYIHQTDGKSYKWIIPRPDECPLKDLLPPLIHCDSLSDEEAVHFGNPRASMNNIKHLINSDHPALYTEVKMNGNDDTPVIRLLSYNVLKARATRFGAKAYNPTGTDETNCTLLQNKNFGTTKNPKFKRCDKDSYRDSRYKAIIQSLYDKQKESADNPLVVLLQEVDDRFVDLLTTSDIWGQVNETVRIKVIRDSPQIGGDTAIAVIGRNIDAYAKQFLAVEPVDKRTYTCDGGFTAVTFTTITSEPIIIVSVHLERSNWETDFHTLHNIYNQFYNKICICGGDMNCNLTHYSPE